MASTSSSTSSSPPRVRPEDLAEPQLKKRKNQDHWQRAIAKKKRNSGQDYVSLATKKKVEAKSIARIKKPILIMNLTVSSQCKG